VNFWGAWIRLIETLSHKIRGIIPTPQLSSKPKQRLVISLLGLSVLTVGFYGALFLLLWLYEGGEVLSLPLWAPLIILIPIFWVSPLAIPSLMVIIVSCYTARKLWLKANPPVESGLSTIVSSSKDVSQGRKRIRHLALPMLMIGLSLAFYYFTFTEDYDAVQSIAIGMNVVSSQSSIDSMQVNFTVFIYMNTLHPSTEETKITGATFTLVVDSQPAGTVIMPFDSQVGGWTTRDIAYDAHFNMTGHSAQIVLQHNPNDVVLTVQFLAAGLLYRQETTKTLPSLYYLRA
jgi:hypothetical protein